MGARGNLAVVGPERAARGMKGKVPSQPKAVPAIPPMPAWLPAEAKAEWKRICPELERMGLVARIDRGILTRYCLTWAKWCEAAAALKEAPAAVDGGREGTKTNPQWRVFVQADAMLSVHASKLGLSYGDRSRLKAPEPEKPASDDLD